MQLSELKEKVNFYFEVIVHRTIVLCAMLLLTPVFGFAEVSIPSCEKLNTFPLSELEQQGKDEAFIRVVETFFGEPIQKWTPFSSSYIASGFEKCQQKSEEFFSDLEWSQDIIRNPPKELFGDIYSYYRAKAYKEKKEAERKAREDERLKRKLEQQRLAEEREAKETKKKMNLKQRHQNRVSALINKYKKLEPSSSFLSSDIICLYQGYPTSKSDLYTVIELYDVLKGKKRWKKVNGDSWLLIASLRDDVTNRVTKLSFVFKNDRKENIALLHRLLVNNVDQPKNSILQIMQQSFLLNIRSRY